MKPHTGVVEVRVELKPTKRVVVYGVDERSLENLAWCAVTYGVNRLFWVDGYLICLEVYEESFKKEIEDGVFPISQVCYTKLPKYQRVLEIEKGTQIPVVNASDMKIFVNLVKKIRSSAAK